VAIFGPGMKKVWPNGDGREMSLSGFFVCCTLSVTPVALVLRQLLRQLLRCSGTPSVILRWLMYSSVTPVALVLVSYSRGACHHSCHSQSAKEFPFFTYRFSKQGLLPTRPFIHSCVSSNYGVATSSSTFTHARSMCFVSPSFDYMTCLTLPIYLYQQ
jgi:hypothetical protein